MMRITLIIIVCCSQFNCIDLLAVPEDSWLTTSQLAEKYGYPWETHYVTTPDGYILGTHRISGGRHQHHLAASPIFNSKVVRKPPVLLYHSLMASSSSFLLSGPEHALGFILADAGYDVWLGNARGNQYSRNHTLWDPDGPKAAHFWDFSIHQMATIDLVTVIDYVREHTNASQLYHVGHSQGATMFYMLMASQPHYNSAIRAHFSLGPAVYLTHMRSPVGRLITGLWRWTQTVMSLFNVFEFVPYSTWIRHIGPSFCSLSEVTRRICAYIYFTVCGFSYRQLTANMTAVIAGHAPAGASSDQMWHYAQLTASGAFKPLDYGGNGRRNIAKYGVAHPQRYDLQLVRTPTYIFYGQNDLLVDVHDVDTLYAALPAATRWRHSVLDPNFNHLDFVWGRYSRELIYERMLEVMRIHNNN